ncbi:hypothetical protein D3C75_1237410 [compost metagenome]
MPKRRVSKIMGDGGTLHHLRINDKARILRLSCLHFRVGTQEAFGRFPGNLCYLQRVGKPRPVIIAGSGAEHL